MNPQAESNRSMRNSTCCGVGSLFFFFFPTRGRGARNAIEFVMVPRPTGQKRPTRDTCLALANDIWQRPPCQPLIVPSFGVRGCMVARNSAIRGRSRSQSPPPPLGHFSRAASTSRNFRKKLNCSCVAACRWTYTEIPARLPYHSNRYNKLR